MYVCETDKRLCWGSRDLVTFYWPALYLDWSTLTWYPGLSTVMMVDKLWPEGHIWSAGLFNLACVR